MTCSFRYVQELSPASVNLHLFRTGDGAARGDVMGPSSRHLDGHSDVSEIQASLTVTEAFSAAIRMANRNDTDLVVSGERSLWCDAWGILN